MAFSELKMAITILDLPEIQAILDEALDAVPEWEQAQLRERLKAVIARAQESRANRG